MTQQEFQQLVERAVKAALAASTVTLVGCGGIDLDGFNEAPCGEERVGGLTTTVEVDYVNLVSNVYFQEFEKSGEACATATDRQSCLEALEMVEQSAYTQMIITTASDTIETYETREEVLAFLGEIDSEADAVTLVWWEGFDVGCGDLERGAVKKVSGGYEVIATRMVKDCDPIEVRQYLLRVTTGGTVTILEDQQYSYERNTCVGRRPDGFESSGQCLDTPAAEYWSTTAHLEAAAVEAFEILAWELERFGAPKHLIERALKAADEEREHTVSTRAIAESVGGEFVAPEAAPRRDRTLLEFALENATEGCVRETFGAAVGAFQAAAARDANVAQAMEVISREETGHAHLSWEIAAWAETQLTADEVKMVRQAQRRAVLALTTASRVPIPLSLVVDVALPTPDQALRMIDVFRAEIWGAAA